MHRPHRASRWISSLIALALLPAVASATVETLPVAETLTFPQLSAPVDVVRDSLGIPHVFASNVGDAAFALGYTHAGDRLFQMDIFRRIAAGRLSELLGFPDFAVGPPPGFTGAPFPGNISNVTQDLFFQTLGLQRAAVDSFNALSPDVQTALQAYADGVNEFIAVVNASGNLPQEYKLLKIKQIESWKPLDTVIFAKLQAMQLSFDFDDGITEDLEEVVGALGSPTGEDAFAEDLVRTQPLANAFTVPDASNMPVPLSAVATEKKVMLAKAERSAAAVASEEGPDAQAYAARIRANTRKTLANARQFMAKLREQPFMQHIGEPGATGSNVWGVSGSVTDTGNPILANDPHLSLDNPATFYELHINTKDRGGDLNVAGVGFAGTPGVVQGHNESIAWGSTVNPADVTDWYLEEISSDGAGNLFSNFMGTPEPITRLPLQVKVNLDNGNLAAGPERLVLNQATGIPLVNLFGIIDVTSLLENFVPPEVLIVDRHGPIFPQTLEPFPFPPNFSGGTALSIQFTGLFPTREIETFFVWNKATTLAEFKSGLQFFDFGAQNWGYADTAGNVAYFTSGEYPIREDIAAGSLVGNPPFLVRDGTGGNEWKALGGPQPAGQSVPFEVVAPVDMPQVENPVAGWFVNANNDPIGNTADNDPLNEALAGTAPYLAAGYAQLRAARITELVRSELNLIATPPGTPAGDGTISFADMVRMQNDVNMVEGRIFAPFFVDAVNNAELLGAPAALASLVNPRIQDARDRLAAWEYNTPTGFDTTGDPGVPSAQDLVDSVATTVYNVAIGQLMKRTFDAALAAAGIDFRPGTTEGLRALGHRLRSTPFSGVGASGINYFDDTSVALSAEVERDMLLVKSLQDALNLLAGASFGSAFAGSLDVDDYLWGKLHYIVFEGFFGEINGTIIPGGGGLSIPPQPAVGFPPGEPANGGREVVDVASYGLRGSSATSFRFGSGPNRRSVVEMAAGAIVAKNVIPGGQDGIVGEPHYGDQIDLWLSNGQHDVLLDTADVVADAESRANFQEFSGCTEPGIGRCAAGRGSKRTDCGGEFFVDAPKTEDAVRKGKFEITDGGQFDFDQTQDEVCVAHVLFCVNNNDPRIVDGKGVQCQSSDVNLYQLMRPRPDNKRAEDSANAKRILNALRTLGPSTTTGKKLATLFFDPPITDQDTCVSTYLEVPLRDTGKKGKKTVRVKLTASDGKTKDKDRLRITCLP